jgi:hypothetical protein
VYEPRVTFDLYGISTPIGPRFPPAVSFAIIWCGDFAIYLVGLNIVGSGVSFTFAILLLIVTTAAAALLSFAMWYSRSMSPVSPILYDRVNYFLPPIRTWVPSIPKNGLSDTDFELGLARARNVSV